MPLAETAFDIEPLTMEQESMKKLHHKLKVTAFASLTAVSAALLVTSPSASVEDLPPTVERHTLPELTQDTQAATQDVASAEQTLKEHTLKIAPNDSLGKALSRLGIPASTTHQIVHTENGKSLTQLNVGDELKVWLDDNNELHRLLYPKSQVLSYELRRSGDEFEISKIEADVQTVTTSAQGTIDGSFYISAQNAGLSPKSIMNLANIFVWDIDFARELQSGDQLKVIYEKQYINGKYIGDGAIIAAQITTDAGKHIHNGFLMRDGDKEIGYFDENGNNLRKAFLKAPLDSVRITSHFNPKRLHPIFGVKRPHRGVDYGARTGTPIRVTGDGKITYRGWNGGYGKSIKVRHINGYETYYAHMSKYGKFKKGQSVQQGQIIGYVGSTGNSTGAHLHYEFRINGKHVDPLKVKFPASGPIAKQYREEFLEMASVMQSQFERFDNNEKLAANFE